VDFVMSSVSNTQTRRLTLFGGSNRCSFDTIQIQPELLKQ
jgi:hypothetical protein